MAFAAENAQNDVSGFARVSAESNKNYPALPWVLPVGLSAKALSSVFTLDWICRFHSAIFPSLSVFCGVLASSEGCILWGTGPFVHDCLYSVGYWRHQRAVFCGVLASSEGCILWGTGIIRGLYSVGYWAICP